MALKLSCISERLQKSISKPTQKQKSSSYMYSIPFFLILSRIKAIEHNVETISKRCVMSLIFNLQYYEVLLHKIYSYDSSWNVS